MYGKKDSKPQLQILTWGAISFSAMGNSFGLGSEGQSSASSSSATPMSHVLLAFPSGASNFRSSLSAL
jgi:hypothetical protein